jgi:hypothetical protein
VETRAPTPGLTGKRFGIRGTDLGYSFEHGGRAVFLFGDTVGDLGGDPMAHQGEGGDARAGARLLPRRKGKYLRLPPDGNRMGGFEVRSRGSAWSISEH